MRIRKRYVIPAVASVAVLALAGVAQAVTNNSSSLSLSPKTSFTPSKVSKTTYKSGTLFAHTHTDFAHPGDKAQGGFPKTVTLLFDNDFKFNTSGVPQCAGSFSSNTTLAQAYSACKSSLIGTGTASTAPNANLPGCVLAFNGQPSGGNPTIVLFTRVFPTSPANCANPASNTGGFTSVTINGTVSNAGVAGFGKKLTVPNLDQLALSLDDFTTSVHRGSYLSARCSHATHLFHLRGIFQYSGSGEPTDTVNFTQKCTVG
jgi:hypothetical protein